MWFKSIKWLLTSNKPNIILIWSVRSGSVSIPHSCNQLEISFQKALECPQKTKRCSRVSSFLSQNEHKGDSTNLSLNNLELVNTVICYLKCYCDQKNNSVFSLDFKTMLTKH